MTERHRDVNSAVVAAAQLKVALAERFGLPVSDADRRLASEPPAEAEWWAADSYPAAPDEVKEAVAVATDASEARTRVTQFVMRVRHELASTVYSHRMGWLLDDLLQMAQNDPIEELEQRIASTMFPDHLVVGERSAVAPMVIAVLNILDRGTRDVGLDEYSEALHGQVRLALRRRGVDVPPSSLRVTSVDLQKLVRWAIASQVVYTIDVTQAPLEERRWSRGV